MITSAQVVQTSVTKNSPFQDYWNPHLDDHSKLTTDTPGVNKPPDHTQFKYKLKAEFQVWKWLYDYFKKRIYLQKSCYTVYSWKF